MYVGTAVKECGSTAVKFMFVRILIPSFLLRERIFIYEYQWYFFLKVLAAICCDIDKESHNIPGEERVIILVIYKSFFSKLMLKLFICIDMWLEYTL
jgi:hypothetical protein